MALRYWRGGSGTWDTTSTTNWSTTSGGAGGASVPTAADDVIINSASGSPTITLTGALNCLSLTTTGATCTFTSTGTLNCVADFTLSSTSTWSATGIVTFTGTGTITTNGVTLLCPVIINAPGLTRTLGSIVTIGILRTLTLTAGTLNLNGFSLSCGLFASSNSNTRAIAFGTGNIITVRGVGSVWNMTIATGFTYTGTPTVVVNNNSATATTIQTHATGGTETNTLDFNIIVGTYTINISSTCRFRNLNFAGFSGTWSPSTGTATFYGNLTLSTSMTYTAGTGAWTFAATSGTQVITTSGKSLGIITQNGAGGTVQLSSTTAVLGTYTLTAGTLDLNNLTLTCNAFSSNASNVRAIAFGTGNITTTGSGTPWNTETVTNLTYTGTPTVNISNNSATAATIRSSLATGSESNSFDFNITTGTYAFAVANNSKVRSLNFTGFSGTWSPTTATCTFYGDLTLVSGMTFTAGTGVWSFSHTTNVQTITSAGKTLGPITQNGFIGTVRFPSGTTTLSGAYTLTRGTLDLDTNTATLSCASFSSFNSNSRAINFGTGNITTTGSGTVWTTATATNLTYTGTPTVNISNNSATATTVSAGNNTSGGSTNAFNFNFTTGTYTLTLSGGSNVRSLNFTGFTGNWSPTSDSATIFGDVTLVSGMAFNAGTGLWTFAGGTTQTLTSAGKIIGSVTISGSGTVLKLLDTFTQSSTNQFAIINNTTLDLNSQTNSIALFNNNFTTPRWINGTINVVSISQTGGTVNWPIANLAFNNGSYTMSGTSTFNLGSSAVTFTTFQNTGGSQTINLGSGTMTLTDSFVPWNINTTGLSFSAGTSTIILDNATNSTTRTFVGGGLAYNKLVIGGDAATGQTVVITGSNAFAELSSTKTVAWTLTLPASTSTSVGNWGITGSAGNVVSIISSSAGTQASLSYTGAGVVTGVDYLSIQDSDAQPSVPATWYAGANSTNVSNNTGWIFTVAPVLASGNYFLMF